MRIVLRLLLTSLFTLYRKLPDLAFLSLRLVLGLATRSERGRLREVALRVVPGVAVLLLFLGLHVDLLAQNPWEDGVRPPGTIRPTPPSVYGAYIVPTREFLNNLERRKRDAVRAQTASGRRGRFSELVSLLVGERGNR